MTRGHTLFKLSFVLFLSSWFGSCNAWRSQHRWDKGPLYIWNKRGGTDIYPSIVSERVIGSARWKDSSEWSKCFKIYIVAYSGIYSGCMIRSIKWNDWSEKIANLLLEVYLAFLSRGSEVLSCYVLILFRDSPITSFFQSKVNAADFLWIPSVGQNERIVGRKCTLLSDSRGCVEKRGEGGSEGACYAKEVNVAGNSIRTWSWESGTYVE